MHDVDEYIEETILTGATQLFVYLVNWLIDEKGCIPEVWNVLK